MTEIKVLLFDVFGTVVDWRTSIAREVESILSEEIQTKITPEDFADQWRALYEPSMEEIRSGRRGYTRLDDLHAESLRKILAKNNVHLSAEKQLWLVHAWHRLAPWPDSISGLTRLKNKFVIAPLSNGNISLLMEMAKNIGLPWDAILGAEVVQTYKPLPAAYLKTADILGVQPSQCMLVAAHNFDLHAAQGCGFKTGFVRRSTEHGSHQSTDLTPSGNWSYHSESITDLADQLHC
ncbi:MAG: haloacid dehalogenase type II [Mycobacteriaceae bacterium]